MAGQPLKKLRKAQDLLARAESLFADLEALTPATYRVGVARNDDLIALAWKWPRESLRGAKADLQFLVHGLEGKLPAKTNGNGSVAPIAVAVARSNGESTNGQATGLEGS